MMPEQENKPKKKVPSWLFFLAELVLIAVIYLIIAFYFDSHFYPNTTVNGIGCSMKTVETVREYYMALADDYQITVYDGEGNSYIIKGEDFSYSYVDSGEVDTLMEEQNSFAWPLSFGRQHIYTMEAGWTYDEEALEECIQALDFLNYDEYEQSQDAVLTRGSDGLYTITEEVYGNEPIPEEVVRVITQAVQEGLSECTLGSECYVAPAVTSEDETLNQALEQIQSYCSATIQYTIGDSEESLDAVEIADMLVIGEDYSVTIDSSLVEAYVQTLASSYNTYGKVRSFVTSLGDTIEIGGGDYGWVIDKSGEAQQILTDLAAGTPVNRDPVYEQTARVSGTDDIGDTYIELDYTNQHLYYYQNGSLVLDCDIVSGNISNGNGSPDGVFKINYKDSPATLVGEDYQSDVTYFMVFAYNVGIHDADWRSSFGGDIYVSSGSHGCINIPEDSAAQLYGMLEMGTPVVAYYRESVSLTSESSSISNAYSYAG